MSSASITTVNKKANYVPWVRSMTRSGLKVRAQNRVLPPDAFTCWDVNTVCIHKVHSCAGCDQFSGDKALISHLRKLSSNKVASYRYRCKSPWTEDRSASTPETTKRKSAEQESASDTAESPNKKKKKRPRRVPLAQSPPPPAVTQDASSPSLSSYLMKRLAARDKQVDCL
jgi:hypothetical protein